MVGGVASCTVKGPGTCYPVGCRPRHTEGKGKGCRHVCSVWLGVGSKTSRKELQSCGSAGRGRTRKGMSFPRRKLG